MSWFVNITASKNRKKNSFTAQNLNLLQPVKLQTVIFIFLKPKGLLFKKLCPQYNLIELQFKQLPVQPADPQSAAKQSHKNICCVVNVQHIVLLHSLAFTRLIKVCQVEKTEA